MFPRPAMSRGALLRGQVLQRVSSAAPETRPVSIRIEPIRALRWESVMRSVTICGSVLSGCLLLLTLSGCGKHKDLGDQEMSGAGGTSANTLSEQQSNSSG